MEEWYALEEFVAENDPYGHLLSNHNCMQPDWGNISGFEMVNRFWKACALGAYATHGETFYMEWLKLH